MKIINIFFIFGLLISTVHAHASEKELAVPSGSTEETRKSERIKRRNRIATLRCASAEKLLELTKLTTGEGEHPDLLKLGNDKEKVNTLRKKQQLLLEQLLLQQQKIAANN